MGAQGECRRTWLFDGRSTPAFVQSGGCARLERHVPPLAYVRTYRAQQQDHGMIEGENTAASSSELRLQMNPDFARVPGIAQSDAQLGVATCALCIAQQRAVVTSGCGGLVMGGTAIVIQ